MRANATGEAEVFTVTAAANPVLFQRVYIYVVTLPSVDVDILRFRAGTNVKVGVRLTTTGTLQLWNVEDNTQIGATSSAISTATWYRLEMGADQTTLAATACEARLYAASAEATSLWNPSGTANLTAAHTNCYVGLGVSGGLTCDIIYDDWACNDNSGSFQNSWPGEGEVIILRPNAAGDNNAWTRGGTDSGANWSQTEEVTPNDVTDYVESNTAEQIDDYNVGATPASMASGDTISAVQVGARLAVSSAVGADPDVVLRIKASASGTVEESAAIDVNTTSYFTNDPNIANMLPVLTLYDLPGASTTAWTKADLDTMQIGIRESVTDTHLARLSAIWVYIDHKPAAAGAYTMAVNVGTYAETGVAAVPKHGWLVGAALGLYNQSGVTALLSKGKKMTVDVGSYALTGVSASLKHGYLITASLGTYGLTGVPATLKHGYLIGLAVGAYSYAGIAAGVYHGWKVFPAVGLYNQTGVTVTLTWNHIIGAYTLTVDVGSYGITGVSASLLHKYKILPNVGAYSLTGVSVGLLRGFRVAPPAGVYALTGAPASLRYNRVLAALLGLYLLNGLDASLIYAGAAFPYQPTQPVIIVARSAIPADGVDSVFVDRDVIEADGQASVKPSRASIQTDDTYRQ